MRIVCAPDAFKESMTAPAAAAAMAIGIRRAGCDIECSLVPMADGGEGTTDALLAALGGQLVPVEVKDALGRPIPAAFGLIGADRAVLEVSAACGLPHLALAERDPRATTTRGVGEMVQAALDRGARRFVIGLGGSATNDAGVGLFSQLGVRFLDVNGTELPPGGAALSRLHELDLSGLDPRLAGCEFQLATDVTNPLLGPDGATAVYGPQKGAGPQAVLELEAALTRWADVVEAATGRSVRRRPGAGAAGGLGAAWLAFTGAEVVGGADLVAEANNLASLVAGADWVFTGEGRADPQTARGKAPAVVAGIAAAADVPVVLFAGQVGNAAQELRTAGVTALVTIGNGPATLEDALAGAAANLATAAENVTRIILAAG